RQEAVAQSLDLAAQAGERRAQLVRDVAHQAAAKVFGALERIGETVEGAGELGDLARRVGRRALAAATLAEAAGDARERLDRRREAPCQDQADAERHGDRKQRGE